MITATNPMVENFLDNMAQLDARMTATERRLSSGLDIQRPSDKPDVAADVVELQGELVQNKQVQANLTGVKLEVDTGEQSLETAMNLLDSAVCWAARHSRP